MKHSKILSTHTTLADAVASAALDLSYNEELAKDDIKRTDNVKNGVKLEKSFVVEADEPSDEPSVFFVMLSGGVRYLHKFSPWCKAISNRSLQAVVHDVKDSYLVFTPAFYGHSDISIFKDKEALFLF